MKRFLAQHAVSLYILLFCAAWFAAAEAWSQWLYTPPLSVAIKLSHPETIEIPVQIHVADEYELWLYFDRAGHSFEEMGNLAGIINTLGPDGKLTGPPGIPMPVRWTLTNQRSKLVTFSGEIVSKGSNSWSAAQVGRLLGKADLSSGPHLFKAEISRGVQGFENVASSLELSLQPKNGHSWQVGISWLFPVLGMFFVLPVAAITSLILLWKLVRSVV